MKFGKKRQCAEWYSSGHNEKEVTDTYKNAILGFIEKNGRTLLFGAFFLTGTPWWFRWFHQKPEKQISVAIFSFFLLFIGVILLVLIAITLVYNRSQKKSNILMSLFHGIIHKIRDDYCESLRIMNNSEIENTIYINNIAESLCEKIRQYFTKLKRTDEIGVAIRVAHRNNENNIVYETIGRANLNPERQKTSVGIPSNEGIPAYFSRQSFSGVLIYNDIEAAVKESLFKLTENEKKYKEEIRSFIVAPLNCFGGTDKSMIGLLYVTSQEESYFDSRDIEHIKALGDLIAIIISQVIYIMKIKVKLSQGGNSEK